MEGYSEDYQKFEKMFNGKIYANGKAKVRVREPKLYTCAVNEVGRDEFLADLNELCGNVFEPNVSLDGPFFKWGKMIKWVIRMGKLFGLKKIEERKLPEPTFKRHIDLMAGNAIRAHTIVLGEIPDARVDNVLHKYGTIGDEEIV